jgi:3-dehydroquinate synthase
MEDLVVPEPMKIKSHKGVYTVQFSDKYFEPKQHSVDEQTHYLIDSKVARLYSRELKEILDFHQTILIDATESNKSIENIIPVFKKLVENKIRRDHCLIAIGGGIIQDITCFIASTINRGVRWKLIPTTLLSQADSCIGSKSSINLSEAKNILGTFYPPNAVHICVGYLKTLAKKEIHSGVGEIIKVHAIKSCEAYDKLSADYEAILEENHVLMQYIKASLLIKKEYIELDEFDKGPRNIFNYGHSFGHAIESATNFEIPHGIAVTIGMGLANYVSTELGYLPKGHEERMLPVIQKNASEFISVNISFEIFWAALMKDKKNTSKNVVVILPIEEKAKITRIELSPTDNFKSLCQDYLTRITTL